MGRKRISDSMVNLDSLLDTMFNVVGILFMMLLVVQLGAKDAVQRITGVSADILAMSPEEVEQLSRQADELRQLLAELEHQSDGLPKQIEQDKLETAKVADLIEKLRKDLESLAETNVELAKVRAEAERKREEQAQLDAKLNKAQEEIEKLKAMLDLTPMPKALEAKVVTLPDPREAPKGSKPAIFVVRYGRIVELPLEQIRELADNRLKPIAARAVPASDTMTGGIDCERSMPLIDRIRIPNPYFTISFSIINNLLYLKLERDKESGDDLEALEARGSKYRQSLALIKRSGDYARFWVWPDSFETYLRAREIAEEMRVPAGWELRTDSEVHTRPPSGLRCNVPKPPPAEPRPATPAPPSLIPPPRGKPLPPVQVD